MLNKQAAAQFGCDATDTLATLLLELRLACRHGAAGPEGKAVIARWRDLAGEAINTLQRK